MNAGAWISGRGGGKRDGKKEGGTAADRRDGEGKAE